MYPSFRAHASSRASCSSSSRCSLTSALRIQCCPASPSWAGSSSAAGRGKGRGGEGLKAGGSFVKRLKCNSGNPFLAGEGAQQPTVGVGRPHTMRFVEQIALSVENTFGVGEKSVPECGMFASQKKI